MSLGKASACRNHRGRGAAAALFLPEIGESDDVISAAFFKLQGSKCVHMYV